jgi:hypothetical protein
MFCRLTVVAVKITFAPLSLGWIHRWLVSQLNCWGAGCCLLLKTHSVLFCFYVFALDVLEFESSHLWPRDVAGNSRFGF